MKLDYDFISSTDDFSSLDFTGKDGTDPSVLMNLPGQKHSNIIKTGLVLCV